MELWRQKTNPNLFSRNFNFGLCTFNEVNKLRTRLFKTCLIRQITVKLKLMKKTANGFGYILHKEIRGMKILLDQA